MKRYTKKRKLDRDDYERAITNRGLGYSTDQSAEDIGVSRTSVSSILRVFDEVRAENWGAVSGELTKQHATFALVEWAAERLGKEIPGKLTGAVPEDNAPAENGSGATAGPNDGLYFIKILEALNKQNEFLEQLIGVVIPKYVCDVKDNANANGDAAMEILKSISTNMDAIRCNTRKRGM